MAPTVTVLSLTKDHARLDNRACHAYDHLLSRKHPMIEHTQQRKELHRPSEVLEALRRLEFGAAVTLTDPGRAELMARFKSA